jgi:hypothetical protein
MTLTVFIIEHGRSSTYLQMLRERLQFVGNFAYVEDMNQINETNKRDFWYLVLHEGEIPDFRLTLAILKILKINGHGIAMVYNLFKKTDTMVSVCPRLFRSDVELDGDSLNPKAKMTAVAVNLLDGFIREV